MQTHSHSYLHGFKNLGYDVCGTNQVNVVAPLFLEREHYPRQPVSVYGATITKLANGIVLTEYTMQVTVSEEYRT
jgi:hypothetical protein